MASSHATMVSTTNGVELLIIKNPLLIRVEDLKKLRQVRNHIAHLQRTGDANGAAGTQQSDLPEGVTSPETERYDVILAWVSISTFATHVVAKKMPSPTSPKKELRAAITDFSWACGKKRISHRDLRSFNGFIKYTLALEKDDRKVWNSLFKSLLLFSRRSNPAYGAVSTSVDEDSLSLEASCSTSVHLTSALRAELRDVISVEIPLSLFLAKYFTCEAWPVTKTALAGVAKTSRWNRFPSEPTDVTVNKWWFDFEERYLKDARHKYQTTGGYREIKGSKAVYQLDLFVETPCDGKYDHNWQNVLVVGLFIPSKDAGSEFWQLSHSVRAVFGAQPTRIFVHAFLIVHTKMSLYVFDRSGAYGTAEFDISTDVERDKLVQIVGGYASMSDAQLGLNTLITAGFYFDTVKLGDKPKHQFEICKTPLYCRSTILGRATCCYYTSDRRAVVKFSWSDDRNRHSEAMFLKNSQIMEVENVPTLIDFTSSVSTKELRSGLEIDKVRPSSENDTRSEADASDESESTVSSSPILQTSDTPCVNRTMNVLVTSPAGRPLSRFISTLEMLRAIRGAIYSHKSLYLTGHYIHRDVSKGNIIIIDPQPGVNQYGMLIDLELAARVVHDWETDSDEDRIVGTPTYMAVEVLESRESRKSTVTHSYRHDLESFLYVFLHICLNQAPGCETSKTDPVSAWHSGNLLQMSGSKRCCMAYESFEERILDNFLEEYADLKGFAWRLRNILFGADRDVFITSTPPKTKHPSLMYDAMLEAFDAVIESLSPTK